MRLDFRNLAEMLLRSLVLITKFATAGLGERQTDKGPNLKHPKSINSRYGGGSIGFWDFVVFILRSSLRPTMGFMIRNFRSHRELTQRDLRCDPIKLEILTCIDSLSILH